MIAAIIFILSFVVSRVSPEDLLKSQFPLYGLAEVAARNSLKVKSSCTSQLKSFYYAVRKHETWALRILDSSGSPVNGFIWGNNYWLGTYSQCRWISLKKPFRSSSSSSSGSSHPNLGFPPFGVDFYISLFKQNTSLQAQIDASPEDLIHLGLCLPSSCTTGDLKPLLTDWANENPLTVQNLYNFTMEFRDVRLVRPNTSWIYNPLTITLCIVVSIALLLAIAGTIYDVYVWTPQKKRKALENRCRINNKNIEAIKTRNIQESSDLLTADNNLNNCYELKIDNSQHKSIPVHTVKETHARDSDRVDDRKTGFVAKLSLCFSVKSNVNLIFESPDKPDDELCVIHGLRFLAMTWLIWLYSVFYLKYYADNRPLAQRLSEGFSEHIVSNSTFSVDTFFFTSGFLLSFKYYKDRRGSLKTDRSFSIKSKVNEFSSLVVERFLRLTPVYAVVLAMVVISVESMRETSIFEVNEPADEICRKYWWRNIAYINNLFKGDEMCMSWSWYLSTDMQYFLMGVFILIISTRFWKFASFVGVTLIIMSSFIAGYLSYDNRYIPTLEPQLALLHVLHYSPWTRVGPYLVGIFTGYFVVHLKGELVVKRTTLITCWLVGTLCSVWALFGLYDKNMSIISTALHTALSRTAWGFGLSWIAIACCTGNGGVLKPILSYPGWIPFSKLSYSAYLLTPLMINLIVSNAETATHLDIFQMAVYFFGHMNIIYFCAFLLSMALEIPLVTLGTRLLGQRQTPNQLNQKS